MVLSKTKAKFKGDESKKMIYATRIVMKKLADIVTAKTKGCLSMKASLIATDEANELHITYKHPIFNGLLAA